MRYYSMILMCMLLGSAEAETITLAPSIGDYYSTKTHLTVTEKGMNIDGNRAHSEIALCFNHECSAVYRANIADVYEVAWCDNTPNTISIRTNNRRYCFLNTHRILTPSDCDPCAELTIAS